MTKDGLPASRDGNSVRQLFKLARRRQHRRRWLIAATATASAVAFVALATVAILSLVSSLDQLGQNLTDTASQFGAVAAVSADNVARNGHVSDRTLTVALLDQQRPLMTWVPPTQSLPATSGAFVVSFSAAGSHVVTANRSVFCTFGLTVSAADDPIIVQDGLHGVGTYAMVPRPSTAAAKTCSADSAPTLGWKRTDPKIVRQLAQFMSGRPGHPGRIGG
jgi:hypothetical protein